MSIQIITPRISEKAYGQAGNINVYTFIVPSNLNKIEIKKRVESEYSVKVLNVNVLVQKGKTKAALRGKRNRPGTGKRSDFKKAYVTLTEGQSIPVFNTSQEGEGK